MTAVILTGIPGSGKTTVLNEALKILERKGISYEHVVYGTVMFELAREKGLVSDRDGMRTLSVRAQKSIQAKAAKKIGELGGVKNIIVDTHCTVKTHQGFIPGLPKDVLDKIKPSQIVIVEASPQEIVSRRENDKSRMRDADSEWDLDLHQKVNRAFAAAYSLQSNASVKVIENRQGGLKEAASELAKVLS